MAMAMAKTDCNSEVAAEAAEAAAAFTRAVSESRAPHSLHDDGAYADAFRAITDWVVGGGMNCGCCREGAKRLKVPDCVCRAPSGGACVCEDCEDCGCCLCECHKEARDFDAIRELEEVKNAALRKADEARFGK